MLLYVTKSHSINYRFVWPRDLCYVRYWRRNDDGSYGNCLGVFPSLCYVHNFLECAVPGLTSGTLQLCYFVLGSMKIVVPSLDLCELILKVNSTEL